jgi:hypothetical protein
MLERLKSTTTYIVGLPQEKEIKKLTNYNINGKYNRIYFYHIRKGAGKSITDMIMATEGKDHFKRKGDLYNAFNKRIVYNNKVIVGWNLNLINKGYYYYAFSHHPYDRIRLPQKTFTFTCLRDPFERVVSHYNMLSRWRNNDNLRRSQKKERKLLGSSFNDYLDNISKNKLLNQLYMFSEKYSISEATDRILGLSYYFFVENFREGIKNLGNHLGLNLKILHTDKSERNSVEIPDICVHRLKELLKPEYDFVYQLKRG